MPSAGFKSAIPIIKRPKTFGLDGMAIGNGKGVVYFIHYFNGKRFIAKVREGKKK
jgi:hypothetical protein